MEQIFHGGTIETIDAGKTPALWVKNGLIAGRGDLEYLQKQAHPQAEKIDLAGKTLVPAFNDAHIHIWKVGDLLTYMLDLRGVASIREMQERLREFAAKNPDRPWVLARGFNEAMLAEGRMPTCEDLDEAVYDRPCYVIRTCAHIAVVNSAALKIVGPIAKVPDGGEVRAGGIFTETALGLVTRHIPPTGPEAYREMILAAQDKLLECGIASATDPAVMPDLLKVYQQMDRAGELKIRVNAIPILVPDGGSTPLPFPALYESDFLKVNCVKLFSDGGLSGKTAALKRPYLGGNEKGVLRLERDFFQKLALKAQEAGFKIATHAIGDAAIELCLEVYGALDRHNSKGLRHRIEHLGLPEDLHLKKMADLGVFCVSQPIFLYELGKNFRQYLPEDYLSRVYPYRSVLEAGVGLAFSSDAPVVKDFNPLMGLQNAVMRLDNTGESIAADEKITLQAALRAYTLGAAEAGDAKFSGTLQVGNRADFVILEQDPELTPVDCLSVIPVFETWVAGQRHNVVKANT
jgi:predicted amidohydrolase YtcJ